MADISRSFSAEGGISLDDIVGIFTGTIDPSITGEDAPIGSIFIRQNGQLYQKTGILDSDWIRFTQGIGEAVKISATDSTSGYLNTKLLVSSSLSKTLQSVSGAETMTLGLSSLGTPGSYKNVVVNSEGRVVSGSNPNTIAGYGIIDAQPLDSTLTSLAAYNTAGLLTQTAADVFVGRTLTGTTNQTTVTNGNGVSGNPTIGLSSTILFPGTAGVRFPVGTTAQRVASAGYTRFNSTTNRNEYYTGTEWITLEASSTGTVTSVSASAPSAGFTVTGGAITTSGTLVFTLSDDLAALENIATTGFGVRTGTNQWATRTINGTADKISVTDGDGINSSPTIDIANNYAGQTSISTLGLVTNGTWQATTIAIQFGGTGRSSIGSANTLLGVNTGGSALEYKTVTAGNGINVAFASQSITVSNTGVLVITGTSNQVIVSGTANNPILSLPQNIDTNASPIFSKVTVAADPTLPLHLATKQYVDNKVQGVVYKAPVRAATTSDITLSGSGNVDGVSIAWGDRVLVKAQNNQSENGVYIVTQDGWVRSTDLDVWGELYSSSVFVEDGETFANTSWYCTVPETGTVGTDNVTWVLFFKSGSLIPGSGISKSGNIISITPIGIAGNYNLINTNSEGRVISGSLVNYLTSNQTITVQGDVTATGTTLLTTTLSSTGVSPGNYRSVTVDVKGRVLSGSNPTTIAGYGLTDAQPLNALLTSASALATSGIMIKNGSSVLSRSIAVGSSKLSIVDATGVSGNPTLDVIEANLTLNNIGGVLGGTKGGTGLAALGSSNQMFGINNAGTAAEYKTISGTNITVTHSAGGINLSTVNNGTVTSVAATGSTGLTVSGSPITGSGTLAFTLGSELQGLSSLAALGIVSKTATGTYAARSIVSGNSTISITNPLGTAGNIGLDLSTIGSAGSYKIVVTDVYGRVISGTNPTTLAGFGITDAVNTAALGVANGVATLDVNGKLNLSQLPNLAITDTFVVSSQSQMTSLTAEIGDIAVRTDLTKTFILRSLPSTTVGNWQELLNPTNTNVGTVTSVSASGPSSGITVTGSPITNSGNIDIALSNDLLALENLASTGFAVRTAADVWAQRSIIAGTGITVTNGTGVAGNVTITSTNNGTVSSVGLSLPSIFTVSGSPITTSGTLTASFANQASNTVFAGSGTAGVSTIPSFRTIGLAQGDLNDVTITGATLNQILSYNGSRWVNTSVQGANASGLVGVGQTGVAAWVLSSGTFYTADFVHNLGTSNVVITVYDSATNTVVIPDTITITNSNTVRVKVSGNTRTLKIVVVANGQSIVAGGSTPSSVITSKDGVTIGTATKLNFVGQAIGVSDAGSGTINVAVGARYSYFANSLDSPNTSDYAINALAPAATDPSFTSLNVRTFSNTVEQGVGFTCSIPPGATQVTIKMRGRAQTAQATSSVVQPRLYARQIPNNSTVGTWNNPIELANITIPNNANFQYAQQTILLSTMNLTADRLYQFELTRRVSGVTGTNLPTNFLLAEITLEFV